MKFNVGDGPQNGTKNAKRRFIKWKTREMSLVDDAANGRRFLVVKRKDSMKKNNKVLKTQTESNVESDVIEVVKFTDISDEIRDLMRNASKFDVDVKKSLQPEQFDMFFAMALALDQFSSGMAMIRNDLFSFIESNGTTGFGGQPVGENVAKRLTECMDNTITSVVDILVEKRGKKMKGERMSMLKGIHKQLTDLITQLDDNITEADVSKKTDTAQADQKVEGTPSTDTNNSQTQANAQSNVTETQVDVAKSVADAVTASVTKALEPVTTKLSDIEKRLTEVETVNAQKSITTTKSSAEETDGTEGDTKTEDVNVKKAWKERSAKERWANVL